MPYTARKQGSKYCVYKKDGGAKVGCTAGTKTALKRYLTALHMHEALTEMLTTTKVITRESLRNVVRESIRKSMVEDAPCWKNYKQIGMKEKDGKQVPNCVPK